MQNHRTYNANLPNANPQLNLNYSPVSYSSRIKRKHRGRRKKIFARVRKWLKRKSKWLKSLRTTFVTLLRGMEGFTNVFLALSLALYLIWVIVSAILHAWDKFPAFVHISHALKLGIEIVKRILRIK